MMLTVLKQARTSKTRAQSLRKLRENALSYGKHHMKKSLFEELKTIQQMLKLRQHPAETKFVRLAKLMKQSLSRYLRQQMLPLRLPSKSYQENFLFECYLVAR